MGAEVSWWRLYRYGSVILEVGRTGLVYSGGRGAEVSWWRLYRYGSVILEVGRTGLVYSGGGELRSLGGVCIGMAV